MTQKHCERGDVAPYMLIVDMFTNSWVMINFSEQLTDSVITSNGNGNKTAAIYWASALASSDLAWSECSGDNDGVQLQIKYDQAAPGQDVARTITPLLLRLFPSKHLSSTFQVI